MVDDGEVVFDGADVFDLLGQPGEPQSLVRGLNGTREIDGPIGDSDLNVGIFVVGLAVEELDDALGDDFVVEIIVGLGLAGFAQAAE
jgi:hypothetical protein